MIRSNYCEVWKYFSIAASKAYFFTANISYGLWVIIVKILLNIWYFGVIIIDPTASLGNILKLRQVKLLPNKKMINIKILNF